MIHNSMKTRLLQLEAKSWRFAALPAVRIIQDGELTDEQKTVLEEAALTGRLVIIREIIGHVHAA